jgi:glycosyltransferase involved in cell wall biosynthesis
MYSRPQQLHKAWRTNFAESGEFYYVDPPRTLNELVVRLWRNLLPKSEEKPLIRANQDQTNVLGGGIFLPNALKGHRVPQWLIDNPFSLTAEKIVMRKVLSAIGRDRERVAIVASPFWEPFISPNDFDLICYDYQDTIHLVPAALYEAARTKHERLIAKSDIVFVTAEPLKKEILDVAAEKDVVLTSNGVDTQFFEDNKTSEEHLGYQKKHRKTVGYIGSIFWWVDLELLYRVAEKLSDVDFLLVGPFEKSTRQYIRNRPRNVFILGRKEYRQVPAYVNVLDVGLILFKPGRIADTIDPIKLYEYFCLGKPVVTTRLKPLEGFNDGRLLREASTPNEFAEAIDFFLRNDREGWRAARKRVALENSWLNKATTIIDNIESCLV